MYSDLAFLFRQYPQLDKTSRCKLLSLLRKALLTLSLWTNTPRGTAGEAEADEELSISCAPMLDSWISFLQLSSQAITTDPSSGQLLSKEQWEESALEHTTQRLLPLLLDLLFHPERDEEINDLVTECLSTCFEFLTGTLSSAKILRSQSEQESSDLMTRNDCRGLWSIFGSLDHVMNVLLSSIHHTIPSLSTSNFQDFLLDAASPTPLRLLPSLQAITASLRTSEIPFFFNLAEVVGGFLDGHLVGIFALAFAL